MGHDLKQIMPHRANHAPLSKGMIYSEFGTSLVPLFLSVLTFHATVDDLFWDSL